MKTLLLEHYLLENLRSKKVCSRHCRIKKQYNKKNNQASSREKRIIQPDKQKTKRMKERGGRDRRRERRKDRANREKESGREREGEREREIGKERALEERGNE